MERGTKILLISVLCFLLISLLVAGYFLFIQPSEQNTFELDPTSLSTLNQATINPYSFNPGNRL